MTTVSPASFDAISPKMKDLQSAIKKAIKERYIDYPNAPRIERVIVSIGRQGIGIDFEGCLPRDKDETLDTFRGRMKGVFGKAGDLQQVMTPNMFPMELSLRPEIYLGSDTVSVKICQFSSKYKVAGVKVSDIAGAKCDSFFMSLELISQLSPETNGANEEPEEYLIIDSRRDHKSHRIFAYTREAAQLKATASILHHKNFEFLMQGNHDEISQWARDDLERMMLVKVEPSLLTQMIPEDDPAPAPKLA